jgi:hypothetical protein
VKFKKKREKERYENGIEWRRRMKGIIVGRFSKTR